jgi:transporter family-2 protein
MEIVAIPLLLSVGVLLALQAGANVQLSAAMGSPFGAATVQLAIGAALLAVAGLTAGSLGALGRIERAEPSELVGGLGSALYISAGILLFPRLGALVAVGLLIAGQMLTSLALDAFGWLGVAHDPPGAAALAGAAAVIAGAWMITRAQAGAGALERAARERTRWIVLALAAGAVLPVQGAINAELNAEVDAALAVGTFSFLVATGAMALVLGAAVALGRPRPRLHPLAGLPWWAWLGGACGATYVTSVFLLIPEVGAAAVVMLTVAGQQVASVLVDRYGWLRMQRRELSEHRLAGVALLLLGVVLVQLA